MSEIPPQPKTPWPFLPSTIQPTAASEEGPQVCQRCGGLFGGAFAGTPCKCAEPLNAIHCDRCGKSFKSKSGLGMHRVYCCDDHAASEERVHSLSRATQLLQSWSEHPETPDIPAGSASALTDIVSSITRKVEELERENTAWKQRSRLEHWMDEAKKMQDQRDSLQSMLDAAEKNSAAAIASMNELSKFTMEMEMAQQAKLDATAAELKKFQDRNTHWGPSVVPESLKRLFAEQSDAGRDFRLIIEDRRVTDLSADYWNQQFREVRGKVSGAEDELKKAREALERIAGMILHRTFTCAAAGAVADDCPKCIALDAIAQSAIKEVGK